MTDFYADLHIHSRFSRATSKSLTLPVLAAWAQIKGLRVLGTGDFTHPAWRKELSDQLVYDEETALYAFKDSVDIGAVTQIAPPANAQPVHFMLQGEISSIYKYAGRVRKIHNIVFMPTLAAVHKFCSRLGLLGNLESDGRPILGLDARDLLELVLETDPRAFLVPAHIWTPWFSLFGSKSGFDSIEECFRDLSGHIFALETGLSSDPAMNRLISALDKVRLISNSDAHSAVNLAREANRFGGAVHYDGIFSALRTPQVSCGTDFLGTLEFFPQEGKYYGDGHRKCGISWTPQQTRESGGKCPVCGRQVTVGVLNRVMELADRRQPLYPDSTTSQTLVPLQELLAELLGQTPKTRKVRDAYARAIARFGSELHILNQADVDDLNRFLMPLGSAVARAREGAVSIIDGYDGEYGVVRVFNDNERLTIERELREGTRSHKQQAEGLSLLGDTIMPKKKSGRRTNKKTELTHGAMPTLPSAMTDKDMPQSVIMPDSQQTADIPVPADTSASPDNNEPASEVDAGGDSALNFIFSDLDDVPQPESLPFLPLGDEEISFQHAVQLEQRLNAEQKKAVEADAEPTLVLAGPGTGKSFTLFARVCRLLKQGSLPRSVLVVTFTRKIATEMDKKLLELLGEGAKLPTVDTLYALALDLWHKTHADVPVLLSQDSARQVFAEANIDEDSGALKDAWESIQLARQLLTPVPAEYTMYASRYTAHKSAWNLADYTDLLEFWLEQARSGLFKPLWEYVLVDEIQELSPLERVLVSLIVPASGRGFFGVGDMNQALYRIPDDREDSLAFFRKKWPDLRVLPLVKGYRSRKGILEVGLSVLHGDASGIPDDVADDAAYAGISSVGAETDNARPAHSSVLSGASGIDQVIPPSVSSETGHREKWQQLPVNSIVQKPAYVHLFKAPTDEAETRWMTDKIAVLLGRANNSLDYETGNSEANFPVKTYRPGDIAILVRTKELGHEIRRSLALIGVPVSQPQEDVFWADSRIRILLQLGCRMLGISLMDREEDNLPSCPDKVLAKGPLGMAAFLSTVPPFDAVFWHSKPFNELVRLYDQCGGWAGLMTWLHLQNDRELGYPRGNKVQILTLHAAKGLEFPVVFLPCLEEGIMPHAGPLLSGRLEKSVNVDEERRLLFMAVTRAQEVLFLSHAAKRHLRGADVRLKASRFLEHLPEPLVSIFTLVSKTQYQEQQLNLFPSAGR